MKNQKPITIKLSGLAKEEFVAMGTYGKTNLSYPEYKAAVNMHLNGFAHGEKTAAKSKGKYSPVAYKKQVAKIMPEVTKMYGINGKNLMKYYQAGYKRAHVVAAQSNQKPVKK